MKRKLTDKSSDYVLYDYISLLLFVYCNGQFVLVSFLESNQGGSCGQTDGHQQIHGNTQGTL